MGRRSRQGVSRGKSEKRRRKTLGIKYCLLSMGCKIIFKRMILMLFVYSIGFEILFKQYRELFGEPIPLRRKMDFGDVELVHRKFNKT